MRLAIGVSLRLQVRCPGSRRIRTSSWSLAKDKLSEPKKTKIRKSALPKLDPLQRAKKADLLPDSNEAQAAIAALPESTKKTSIRKDTKHSSKHKELSEEEDLEKAIRTGVIPDTPLAREVYVNWKRFPDCILLTRVGNFYESYFEPARQLASILSISLAEKKYGSGKGSYPFAGFPVHALDKFLKILVQDLGHTVVLVEEYDSDGGVAYVGKKLTGGSGRKERKVCRVLTPGTMVDAGWLDTNESRYLLAVAVGNKANDGGLEMSLAYTDPSTGDFFTKDTTSSQMEDELTRITPREVVLDNSFKAAWQNETNAITFEGEIAGEIKKLFSLLQILGVHVSFANPYRPPPLWSTASLLPFSPNNTEDYAIALLRHHLEYTLRETMPALNQPDKQINSAFMQIDATTLQALEIRHALRPGGLIATGEVRPFSSPLSSRGTLLSVISKTVTPSGHRLLIRTLTAPSTCLDIINSRLALVQAFVDREDLRTELRDELRSVGDVMRIVQRCRGQRATGTDIWNAGKWVKNVQRIRQAIEREIGHEKRHAKVKDYESEGIQRLQLFLDSFSALDHVASKIEASLDEEAIMYKASSDEDVLEDQPSPGTEMFNGKAKPKETDQEKQDRMRREREEKDRAEWWIKPSFSHELKSWHEELISLKSKIQKLQRSLSKKFGTSLLVVEKNGRYGYHIQLPKKENEKTAKARSLEPIGATTGRTLYYVYGPLTALGTQTEITVELLGAAQRRAARDLQSMIVDAADAIQHNASLIDELDLCMNFAQNAVDMSWVRPILNDSTGLEIVAGRHPSIESSLLSSSRVFTPNSTHMTPCSHLHVITGPNQGGKSTLLRQTAVITILAQSGSFVPAEKAEIGVVDKVFSRVGARDDLWRDRSTFMLEMVETASILRYATERSLVIMDEIGRGTTLQAGISIAYATLDYILRHIKCRTLFATHYHELGGMLGYSGVNQSNQEAKGRDGISFWCTDIDESNGAFSYSYTLRPGINYNSHAIKAASLAGMPPGFLSVARQTLAALEASKETSTASSVSALLLRQNNDKTL
ncbi:hypothetical protein L204_106181 [Cryptococcus depauperatus]|nr:hypothetical protein L204_05742 [Cryptococcus depauperatus CBS 7855]